MERRGIISMGNWLVDSVKFIDVYPVKGNLVTIRNVEVGLGGCSHNVLVDLARLKSGLPLYAGGCIGRDDCGQMVLDAVSTNDIDGRYITVLDDAATSYTDVMSEINGDVTRTFFHCRGANARLTIDHVRAVDAPAKIFHLGYLLLLDEMDKADPEYGVVAARALKELQEKGYETSIDVVSEEGNRFRQVILPCLAYTDYLIVNEVEAGACCNMELRDSNGGIDVDGVRKAAGMLMEMGVRKMCVIHFPEGGLAMTKDGSNVYMPTDMIPKSEIVSAVGAGDAFCAGTLYALHEGYEMEQMLRFANACARFNLANATSTGGAPTLKEINEYLNK